MTRLSSHLRATLGLGLPLIGSMLAQMAITLTDTVMMGWYGVEELAAVALGGSYFHVILILGMGFGLAVMPLVAAAAANDDRRQVRRVTRMGLWIGLIFSALVMPLFIFSGPILLSLGQAPEVARLTEAYLVIAGWGIAPAVLTTVLRSHLSALDHARIVLWATLAHLDPLGLVANRLAIVSLAAEASGALGIFSLYTLLAEGSHGLSTETDSSGDSCRELVIGNIVSVEFLFLLPLASEVVVVVVVVVVVSSRSRGRCNSRRSISYCSD
jgi:Na+-driven multidrug efflux pump